MGWRVLVVDDHHLILAGLSELIEGAFEGSIVDGADSGEQASILLKQHQYDIVITDLFLPGEPTYQFLKEVCRNFPEIPAVVISGSDTDSYISKCIDAGAHGFISKAASQAELINTIEKVLEGSSVFPNYQRIRLSQQIQIDNIEEREASQLLQTLSQRKLEVVKGIEQGKSNKEIAYDLGLSENTIKVHVSGIIKLLGVDNRTKISILAQKANLK